MEESVAPSETLLSISLLMDDSVVEYEAEERTEVFSEVSPEEGGQHDRKEVLLEVKESPPVLNKKVALPEEEVPEKDRVLPDREGVLLDKEETQPVGERALAEDKEKLHMKEKLHEKKEAPVSSTDDFLVNSGGGLLDSADAPICAKIPLLEENGVCPTRDAVIRSESSPASVEQPQSVSESGAGTAAQTFLSDSGCEIENELCRAAGMEDLEDVRLSEPCSPSHEDIAALTSSQDHQHCARVEYEVLEKQNLNLLGETADQKKVIEMLRVELTKKDEELVRVERGWREDLETHDLQIKKLQDDTSKRFVELKKAYELANRDKEAMVIKYAMGEKEILVAKKGKEVAEKKLAECNKDKESLQYKIKTLNNERTRLQGLCDARAQETLLAKKEGEKWREETRQTELKLTAANNKLKAEADAHRETKESLERTLVQLAEVQSSLEKQRQEQEEDSRREKEQEVKLMIDSVAAAELDNLRRKHRMLLEENNALSIKVQTGEKERLAYESTLSQLKETANRQRAEVVDLYARCAELESVKLQLDREVEKCNAKDVEICRLRAESLELHNDMTACRSKEAELLDFTQKLTDKNVNLQSEFSSMEHRTKKLEDDHSRLVITLEKAETRLRDVIAELEHRNSSSREEIDRLNKLVTERTEEAARAVQVAVDASNEVEVLRRQNTVRLKELNKELATAKKRLAALEPEPGICPHSRTSSNSSLNKPDIQEYPADLASLKSLSPVSPSASHHLAVNGGESARRKFSGDIQVQDKPVMPDTQVLVEKIVKLQRSCARRQEKLDFLEEHVEQLLAEVQKKSRIIQAYALSSEPGALISEQSDIHKAVMGSQAGIMSSVYSSKVTDSGMTLELSLEINRKLQAVLEDTLLKNITLKESINTLGGEIARLAK